VQQPVRLARTSSLVRVRVGECECVVLGAAGYLRGVSVCWRGVASASWSERRRWVGVGCVGVGWSGVGDGQWRVDGWVGQVCSKGLS
jgi:hypothetical protein